MHVIISAITINPRNTLKNKGKQIKNTHTHTQKRQIIKTKNNKENQEKSRQQEEPRKTKTNLPKKREEKNVFKDVPSPFFVFTKYKNPKSIFMTMQITYL